MCVCVRSGQRLPPNARHSAILDLGGRSRMKTVSRTRPVHFFGVVALR